MRRSNTIDEDTSNESTVGGGAPHDNDDKDSSSRKKDVRRRTLRERRHAFVTDLLQHQYEHQQLGLNDPKGLFQLSRAASKPSRLRAIQTAGPTSATNTTIPCGGDNECHY